MATFGWSGPPRLLPGRTVAAGHEGSPVSLERERENSWGAGAFDGEFADRVPTHVPNSAILTRANCTELH